MRSNEPCINQKVSYIKSEIKQGSEMKLKAQLTKEQCDSAEDIISKINKIRKRSRIVVSNSNQNDYFEITFSPLGTFPFKSYKDFNESDAILVHPHELINILEALTDEKQIDNLKNNDKIFSELSLTQKCIIDYYYKYLVFWCDYTDVFHFFDYEHEVLACAHNLRYRIHKNFDVAKDKIVKPEPPYILKSLAEALGIDVSIFAVVKAEKNGWQTGWDNIPDDYVYRAMDKMGRCCCFKNYPSRFNSVFHDGCEYIEIGENLYIGDWENSLQKRPNKK